MNLTVNEDNAKDPVKHKDGHARVVAGPGTGKTTTIVKYVQTLVEERDIDPEKIIVITFSNATARELDDQIQALNLSAGSPEARTLHSYCFKELRKNTGSEFVGNRILDDWEVKELLRVDLGHRLGRSPAKTSDLLNAYDAAWRTLGDIHSIELSSRFESEVRNLREVFDFALLGELVYMFKRFLDGDPSFKPDIKHFLVDEYQDLNACDLAVIRELSKRTGCQVFVVGDDDQCIYKFRHSDPSGIREFPRYYDNAIDYQLETCYRCGRPILESALLLMKHDEGRLEKTISAFHEEGNIHIYGFRSPQKEYTGIVKMVSKHIAEGVPEDEILILIPRRALAKPYVEKLKDAGIAVENLASPNQILDEPEVRKLKYAIEFSRNNKSALAVRGWLQTMAGIGPKSIAKVIDHCLETSDSFLEGCIAEGSPQIKAAIDHLLQRSEELKIEDTFEKVLAETAKTVGLSDEEVLELKGLAIAAHVVEEEPEAAEEKLAEVEEPDEQGIVVGEKKVKVMTLRKAKGLSSQVVIATDLDEDIIPGQESDISEQRRLLYVSMTRARRHLYLTHVNYRWDKTSYAGAGARAPGPYRQRSRFLDELDISSENLD